MVRVTIFARPQTATVIVDGNHFGNEVVLERPREAAALAVHILAPGYRSRRLDVPLDRNRHLDVELELVR
jgi:hypothetical protein